MRSRVLFFYSTNTISVYCNYYESSTIFISHPNYRFTFFFSSMQSDINFYSEHQQILRGVLWHKKFNYNNLVLPFLLYWISLSEFLFSTIRSKLNNFFKDFITHKQPHKIFISRTCNPNAMPYTYECYYFGNYLHKHYWVS